MSDRIEELEAELHRVVFVLKDLIQWNELGRELGLSSADLDSIADSQKESGL